MSIYRVYQYDNAVVPYKHILMKGERSRAGDTTKKKEQERREKFTENDAKIEQAICRAKRVITELALCNDFDWYATFEFDDKNVDRYDLHACYKKIRTFFNNFQKRYAPSFEWLIIPEFHPKTNAIHFHGLFSGMPQGELSIPATIQWRDPETDELKQIPNKKGYVRWERYSKSLGFFDCSRIRSRERTAFYITKYVTKELAQLPKGVHMYACSRGLQRPKLVYDGDDDYMALEPSFENDFCKIAYDRYEAVERLKNDTEQVHKAFGDSENVGRFISPEEFKIKASGPRLPYWSDGYNLGAYYDYELEIPYEQTRIKK